MNKQGTIVRWDAERGFGFVSSPATEGEVYFHLRDYRGGRTAPSEGMSVSFEEIHVGGKGPRAMAVQPLADALAQRRQAVHEDADGTPMRSNRPPYSAAEINAMLLLVPAWLVVLGWAAWSGRFAVPLVLSLPLLSVVTFYLFWRDRFAAQSGGWRVPAAVLHAFSLVGGWPGGWLGQRLLRHKFNDPSFRLTHWISVAVHWIVLVVVLLSTAPAR